VRGGNDPLFVLFISKLALIRVKMPKEILFRGYYRGGAKTHVFPKYALSFFADLKATLDVPIQEF